MIAELMIAASLTVHVGDNYFTPTIRTVKQGATVTWKWPSMEQAGDVHDVKLKSGPKGVKTFRSQQAASDYTFKRKLKVAGTYKLVCTLHEEMRVTLRVR